MTTCRWLAFALCLLGSVVVSTDAGRASGQGEHPGELHGHTSGVRLGFDPGLAFWL
jgi:hypothetical protein